ncbi:hypothetical protein CORC01_00838 [Colletotrichum orchidophilum]|uniref:Tat pathway signal sequence n=1 Tax=Colletotrichum orchidophilum TaxID=1209926 RepID=A0A1G4BRP8_9PEZI|nr:uncharacterized protein CORC01_00838 [Colletotrichum orchidophilum]OHF03976.1 hypothetical protein CORC01_00838 [Colletotrichum orchidophilum]
MGKKVTFASKMRETAKYEVLGEGENNDDDIESLGGVERNCHEQAGSSPTFPYQWSQDRVLWDQQLRKIQRLAWAEEIGQPVKWAKYDDETDPHYFKPDVFKSLESVQAAARDFKMLHNASNVRINGKHTTYMDFDGARRPLPAYVTRKGSELYSIRAFHQMHCISIIFEDIGYRVNNRTSKWETGHVIHCLNTVRSAITCLADATPISYVHGMGVGHTTDDQQSHCRDFFALREWAHDPARAVKWVNIAPEDEKDKYHEIID